MDGKNVLSIVLEIDCARHLRAPLVGSGVGDDDAGKVSVRIERVGRPEVKNLLLAPKQFDQVNRDLEIRDIYNMEDGVPSRGGLPRSVPRAVERESAFWDGLDGKADWAIRMALTR